MDTSALPIIICGHTVSVWHQFELVQRRRIFTTFANRLGSQARPRFHEGAAFFQGIAAAVGLLGLVADHMRQRCFDQLARMTGFISGPIAEAGSETMNVLGLHAAQHHFRRHARQRFVARLLGKANSFSRWRGITTACADIIHTRTRRMFALLLATHRGKKAGCKSSTSNHRPMICFSGRFYFLW